MAKKMVVPKAPSATAVDLAEKLLDIARGDLAAARALHGRQLYPQSVFSLQQAVEKTAKACGLVMGVSEPSELASDWSHNSLRLSELLVDYRAQQASIADENTTPSTTDSGMSPERLKAFIKDLRDPSALNDAFLTKVIDWSKSLIADDRAHRANPAKVQRAREEMVAWAISGKTDPNQVAKATAYASHIAAVMVEMVVIQQGLMVLGMATIPHAVRSRYPMDGRTPTALYTAQYPLVRHFSTLSEISEVVMTNVRNLVALVAARPAIDAMPD